MSPVDSLRRHPLENRIPPPVVVVLIGAVMWIADRVLPGFSFDLPFRFICAGVIGALGLLIFILGVREFRRARTTVNPINLQEASAIVTSGIYSMTRNPMYVGFTLALVGWSIFLGNGWTLIGPIVFAIFSTIYQIIPEERLLASKFGEPYEAYCRRVRRWL